MKIGELLKLISRKNINLPKNFFALTKRAAEIIISAALFSNLKKI